jgi:hypothetical protein
VRRQCAVNVIVASFEKGCHVEYSGVVDKDIESTEVFQGALDDRISAVGRHDAVPIRHCLASSGNNFIGDITGGSERFTQTLHAAAEIIHDDLRSTTPQFESVGTSETPPSSSDDCYSAFESEAHGSSPRGGE